MVDFTALEKGIEELILNLLKVKPLSASGVLNQVKLEINDQVINKVLSKMKDLSAYQVGKKELSRLKNNEPIQEELFGS